MLKLVVKLLLDLGELLRREGCEIDLEVVSMPLEVERGNN